MNIELLNKPFDKSQIKKRKGREGKTFDYIEVADFVTRLNEAFDFNWSFEIVEHHIQDEHIIVLGRLSAGGVVKTAFGSGAVIRSRAGVIIDLGDDFKAAASDALKKAATLFGVGLHIYGSDSSLAARAASEKHLITTDQQKKIADAAKAVGWSVEKLTEAITRRYGRPMAKLDEAQAAEVLQGLLAARAEAV